ncbi:hypothetical protein VPT02_131 [Vibrio phage VPT02]|nr:hypothetical protein VPT02_131 [Vibrio phage VPT02]
MKTLKVDLGGKLPDNVLSVCIYLDHLAIVNGDSIEVGNDELLYHTLEVKPLHGEQETSDEPWKPFDAPRKVTVDFPVLMLDKGARAYALVVQPEKDLEAILVVAVGNEERWYDLPKDLKIELLNY